MTTRIGSGARRHRIAVRDSIEATTTHGEITRTFFTKKTVWGRLKTLSGKEADVAKQIAPSATYEVTVPYISWLTEKMKFRIRGKSYGIVAIDNRDLENVEQICLCEEAK